MNTEELKEIKNELRSILDDQIVAVGASKTVEDIVEVIGKSMFKLNEFAELSFAVEEPKKPEPSRIIIP